MSPTDPEDSPEDPTAIVVGGAGEVGEGLVHGLLADGYRVVVPTRDPLRGDALLERLGSLGERVSVVVGDVTTDRGVASVREVLTAPPKVVVVALGSGAQAGPLVSVQPDAFDRVIAADLRSHYLVARGFAALVAGAHGVYALVVNGAAMQAVRGSGPASVAGAGQLALAEVLAAELPSLHVLSVVLAAPVRTRSRNRNSLLDLGDVTSVLVRAIHDPRTRGLTLVVDKGAPGLPTVSTRERGRLEPFTPAERRREAEVDETLDESFPASDPPSWTLGRERH